MKYYWFFSSDLYSIILPTTGTQAIWPFLKFFHWIRWIHKFFVITAKGFKPAIPCVRDQGANHANHSTNKTHVRDKIFKLTPIHASVIYQILWIYWISIPFRENSTVSKSFTGIQFDLYNNKD